MLKKLKGQYLQKIVKVYLYGFICFVGVISFFKYIPDLQGLSKPL